MKKVRLDDIASAIGSDVVSEGVWYLDTESGVTEYVQNSIMDAALRRADLPIGVPADVRLMYILANDVILDEAGERFLKLPGQLDVLEWDIMRRFAIRQKDADISHDLTAAIQGQNAFQAFNFGLRKFRLQNEWQSYRERALRDVAAEWCTQHGVPFE